MVTSCLAGLLRPARDLLWPQTPLTCPTSLPCPAPPCTAQDGNGRLDVKEFTAFLEQMDAELFMEGRYQQQQQQPTSGDGGRLQASYSGHQGAGGGGGGRSSRSMRAGARGGAEGSGEDDGDGGHSSLGARSSARGQGSAVWGYMGGVARQGSGDVEAGAGRSSSVGPLSLRSSILARFTRTAKGAGARSSMESNVSRHGEQQRAHSPRGVQQQQQHRSSSPHVQMQDMSGHRADRDSDCAGSGASTPRAAAPGGSPRHWVGGRASAFAGAAPLQGSVSVGVGKMAGLADGADGLARAGSAGSRLVLASPPSAVVTTPSAPSSFSTAAAPPPQALQGAPVAAWAHPAPVLGPGQEGLSGQSQAAASAGAVGTPRGAGAWEAAAAAAAGQYSGWTPGHGGSGGGGGSPRGPAEGASGAAAAHAGAGGPPYGRSGSGGWARSGGAFVGAAAAEAGGRTGPALGHQHLGPQGHRRPPQDLQLADDGGSGASVPASYAHTAPHHLPRDPPWCTPPHAGLPRASSHPSSPGQVHATGWPQSPGASPSPRPTSPQPTQQSTDALATRRHQHAHAIKHQHPGPGSRSRLRSPAEVRRHPSTSVIQESPEEDGSVHDPSNSNATTSSRLPVSTPAEITGSGTISGPGEEGPGAGASRSRSSGAAAEGNGLQAAVAPAPNGSLFMRLGSLPSRLSSWAGAGSPAAAGGGSGGGGSGLGAPLRTGSGGDGRREAPASPASPGGTRLSGLLGSVFGRPRSLGRDPRDGTPPAAWGRHVAGHVAFAGGELPLVGSPSGSAAARDSPGTGPPSPAVAQLPLPAQ